MSTNGSETELCPSCGQPGDMFIFYHLLDDEKDFAVGFGCSNCKVMSRPMKLPKETVRSLFLKQIEVEREKRGGD